MSYMHESSSNLFRQGPSCVVKSEAKPPGQIRKSCEHYARAVRGPNSLSRGGQTELSTEQTSLAVINYLANCVVFRASGNFFDLGCPDVKHKQPGFRPANCQLSPIILIVELLAFPFTALGVLCKEARGLLLGSLRYIQKLTLVGTPLK